MVRMIRIGLLSACAICLAGAVNSQPAQLTAEELALRLKMAGNDPAKLLALVALSHPEQAKEIRQTVHKLLVELSADSSPAERQKLTGQMTGLIATVLHTPDEVLEVLGTKRKISRQLLHRRYLEQWVYEQPLPLVVTFEFRKGQPPRLFSIHSEKSARL